VNVHDRLAKEARKEYKGYRVKDENGRNQARSLGLMHLFLKPQFGLMAYSDRIKFVIDGRGAMAESMLFH
jgi:hypothetical protein